MNNDIIAMAREAGMKLAWIATLPGSNKMKVLLDVDQVERFAALARADEREACAKVCDEASDKALSLQSGRQDDLGSIILRHHAVAHQSDAAAIRARGQA
jgi:flagellar motility protein MotE (MotC chaperone)